MGRPILRVPFPPKAGGGTFLLGNPGFLKQQFRDGNFHFRGFTIPPKAVGGKILWANPRNPGGLSCAAKSPGVQIPPKSQGGGTIPCPSQKPWVHTRGGTRLGPGGFQYPPKGRVGENSQPVGQKGFHTDIGLQKNPRAGSQIPPQRRGWGGKISRPAPPRSAGGSPGGHPKENNGGANPPQKAGGENTLSGAPGKNICAREHAVPQRLRG